MTGTSRRVENVGLNYKTLQSTSTSTSTIIALSIILFILFMNYYTKDMPPEDLVHDIDIVISAASQGFYSLFLFRRH